MSQSPRLPKEPSQTTKRPDNAVLLMTMTALDTSWRMFVPIVGGTVAGVALDRWLHIVPIMTIILLLAGIVLAGLLVRNQFKSLRKDS